MLNSTDMRQTAQISYCCYCIMTAGTANYLKGPLIFHRAVLIFQLKHAGWSKNKPKIPLRYLCVKCAYKSVNKYNK